MASSVKGILKRNDTRIADDPEYLEAAITPPGNHPLGGHVQPGGVEGLEKGGTHTFVDPIDEEE